MTPERDILTRVEIAARQARGAADAILGLAARVRRYVEDGDLAITQEQRDRVLGPYVAMKQRLIDAVKGLP